MLRVDKEIVFLENFKFLSSSLFARCPIFFNDETCTIECSCEMARKIPLFALPFVK